MAWADFNPRRLVRALAVRGVDFVVIGGFAAVIHGSPRLTQDLDITYATDPGNLVALGQALVDLDASLRDAEDAAWRPDARSLKQVSVLTLSTSAGPLDLLAVAPGAPPYDDLRRNAWRADIGGVAVLVASIDDLLAMKRELGRAKDLADVEELEAVKRLGPGRV